MPKQSKNRPSEQKVLNLPENFPIHDAIEPLLIHVEESDRALGVPGRPDSCAFSVACRRENGEVIRTEFLKTVAYLIYSTHVARYILSRAARRQVSEFDEKLGFVTGDYLLNPPTGRDKLGESHNPSRTGVNRNTRPPVMPMRLSYIRGRPVFGKGE
jgi:hypothetical protein